MLLFTRSFRLFCVFYPLLGLLSCSFSSRAARKRYLLASDRKPYDVIIVPGVPFENGQWSRVMKGRIYWSKFLYDHGVARNIIYSGGAVYSPYAEGEIMAQYAMALGIPPEHVYRETRAEHSTENIFYSYQLARKLGFKSVAVASDPFQTRMLKRFIREKINPDIDLIPMLVDTLKAMEPQMTDPAIDPSTAFRKDFISITRRQGFWKRIRGTLGKNIDTTAYQP